MSNALKVALCLLPLLWGLVTSYLQPLYLQWFLRIVLFLPLVWFIYGKSWDQSLKNRTLFFGLNISFGTVFRYIAKMFGFLLIYYFVPETYQVMISALLLGTVMEELITRSFFLKYPMTPKAFLFWAFLSSTAFSLTHWLYGIDGYVFSLTTKQIINFFNHFNFGFILAAVTYRTGRLEVAIILHALSNAAWTTGSLLSLGQESTLVLFALSSLINLLALVGCTKAKEKALQ